MVSAFAHGAMGHRIDPSWAISCSSQCSTTSVTKTVVCAILSVGWSYKRTLAVNRKELPMWWQQVSSLAN